MVRPVKPAGPAAKSVWDVPLPNWQRSNLGIDDALFNVGESTTRIVKLEGYAAANLGVSSLLALAESSM